MAAAQLTGLEGKVAVVTGAGRMRSIGRPIAVDLASAGCKIVLTGTGREAGALSGGRAGGGLAGHRLSGGRRSGRLGRRRWRW